MENEVAVSSAQEALQIARDYAHANNVNEVRAEAFAEVWFDAGKDFDKSGASALRRYLDSKFEIKG